MSVGPLQLIVVALLILVLFGRGRISEMMGDFGKGIKSFKEGMSEESSAPKPAPRIESGARDTDAAAKTAADPAPAERSDTAQ